VNEREKAKIIRDALRDLHKNETLERAIGRLVRGRKGSYQDYMDIISSIRDMAQKKKIDLIEAAKRVAAVQGW
jgi:hypothetical protein